MEESPNVNIVQTSDSLFTGIEYGQIEQFQSPNIGEFLCKGEYLSEFVRVCLILFRCVK